MINPSKSRIQTLQLIFVILTAILIPVGLTYFNYQFSLQNPGGNDFLARWNGAHEWLVNGNNPYTDEVSLVAQKFIYGRAANPQMGEDIAHFVYPLYSMIFFAPFGLMEYTFARALFMTLLEISLVLITLVSIRITGWKVKKLSLLGILLFSVFWYCAIRGVIVGQYAVLNALLMLLAVWAVKEKQDIAAGILLILSTSKPQMSYLLVVYIFIWAILSKRPKIILSMVATTIVLFGVTSLLLPGWILDWIRQLVNYPSYTDRIGSTLSIISGLMPGIMEPVNIFLHGVFYLYLVVEWFRSKGKGENGFIWTAFLTLVITNLVAYRTATPHYVALIAPLFLISRVMEERWGKSGRWVSSLMYVVIFVGLWMLFLTTVQGVDEQAVMYVPVPFLILIFMWWMRWWMMRPITAYFDSK